MMGTGWCMPATPPLAANSRPERAAAGFGIQVLTATIRFLPIRRHHHRRRQTALRPVARMVESAAIAYLRPCVPLRRSARNSADTDRRGAELQSALLPLVIVSDKQPHLVYLDMDAAVIHCTKGIGIWDWASNDADAEPDVVVASAGDIMTQEALAAVAILRQNLPDLKIRFVNVVDLYRLQPDTEHPHGLCDRDFDSLFTKDKPVIFNFHGYPWLIHKFTYRRTNHSNIHVRGYK